MTQGRSEGGCLSCLNDFLLLLQLDDFGVDFLCHIVDENYDSGLALVTLSFHLDIEKFVLKLGD